MEASISFRCAAKTEPGAFRTIVVFWPGPKAACNCAGFNGAICSHIDATLLAGERAMVPAADRDAAGRAMQAITGLITVPPDWKASWRKDYAWRGLPTRTHRQPRIGLSGRPIVCFTGSMPKPRGQLLRDADTSGWETVDRPHSKIRILVAADPNGPSAKLSYAREKGIPILTLAEWTSLTTDGELAKIDGELV